ncbi:SurA N-terminal domain-containing protein [Steroidobacter sp. S1-65]|uniref:Periplasmic chaperone PpiD n=1 Tax=Steroidobacter gossypii TaxID=2805490 RepID=A0ABS1WYT7_9GAMM|nr:SurA N-terminal domain-containing protein [Steroidobacter gossypii]MBM0106143.1 SurA N-terminal domain-containing protein [Steroidobacter gossypii]
MLQTIRDKITGWVAGLFLGAIAIVFVFWGIDFQSTSAAFAAKVDGERIPAETVRRAWQQRQSQLQQMLRDELPPEMAKAQQSALLDQFVQQSLLTQRAHDLGYQVSDQALVKRIMEIPQFQVDGKFSQDRYAGLLRSNGTTESQFESDLQAELLLEQLQNGVMESAFTVPYELDRRYALEKQQREIDYALIPANEFLASAKVTDEQIQQYYEQNGDDFLLPETVDLQYIELTRAQAESKVDVSEQALKEYYEQVKERFESPERRQARHILITATDGLDDAAAQKKAQELTEKAKGGADFAQLAKQNSKDPGSAEQGGDLGWAQKGMFVGPFEDALFSMQPGEIRGPVKTQFGYHVLKLENIEKGHLLSFEEARAEVEAEYRKDRAQSGFYDDSQKMADAAFEALTELDSVAKKMNLQVKEIKGFTREGGGEFGADPGVIDAAFSEDVLERRQNSPLIPVGEDKAVVLRVVAHKPAEPRPLAEVRGAIESQLRSQQAREAAAAKGADAVARLQKGENWEALSALGVKPVGKRFVTRDDSIAPPAVLRSAFQASKSEISEAKPYVAGVTTDDGNYAVLAVTQVRNAEASSEAEAERNNRRRQLERRTGGEELTAYVEEAERNADIVRNEKVFE